MVVYNTNEGALSVTIRIVTSLPEGEKDNEEDL
jgi:hypothetical protein